MKHLLSLIITIILISYNGQSQSNISKVETNEVQEIQEENVLLPKAEQGVISVFEDSKGNFWFGSKENGVCKFYDVLYKLCPTTYLVNRDVRPNIGNF